MLWQLVRETITLLSAFACALIWVTLLSVLLTCSSDISSGNHVDGIISGVRIWDQALNEAQSTALYASDIAECVYDRAMEYAQHSAAPSSEGILNALTTMMQVCVGHEDMTNEEKDAFAAGLKRAVETMKTKKEDD